MAPRLMLLDSASMYFRAFYGVPDRFSGSDGAPTNAVRGFLDALARLVEEYCPTELVACWDDDWRPQFRVDLVASYKAHRVAGDGSDAAVEPQSTGAATGGEEVPDRLQVQEPVIRALLAALGIARVGVAGFEADDVIAWYSRVHPAAQGAGAVDIITGDRDLFQLVDDTRGVRVLYTGKGMRNLQTVDEEWLQQSYGVPARLYADFAILRGDSSDGLPGVSGVGDKTAAKLVNDYGGLAQIQAAAADPAAPMRPRLRQQLLEAADYLRRADPVVRLMHTVTAPEGPFPLPAAPVEPAELVRLADFHEVGTSVDRVVAALAVAHSRRPV